MPSLPFSTEAFRAVLEAYNLAIWPAQVVAYGLGGAVVVLVLTPVRHGDRLAAAVLALAWIAMGVGYHIGHFGTQVPISRADCRSGAGNQTGGPFYQHGRNRGAAADGCGNRNRQRRIVRPGTCRRSSRQILPIAGH